MKTYKDILRHHIRNKDLLNLIEYYNHEDVIHHNRTDILCKEIDNQPCKLQDVIYHAFSFKNTREGYCFWSNLIKSLPRNCTNFYIDQWKPIDEWFKDVRIPLILRVNSEKYIEYILANILAKRKLLYFHNMESIFHLLCDNTFIFCDISYEEQRLIKFLIEHDRFSNDFDD